MNCKIHDRLGGMSFLPIMLLLFIAVHPALAQTTAFTYQGKLTDAGLPANATFDMQFKMFDTVDVGTGIQQGGTITNPTVQVTGGIFTVQLDFGAGVFDLGRDRFLEIGVRPAGNLDPYTILAPRQQVTSTPYTIRSLGAARADLATNALQLGGLPASGFIQNTTSQQTGANFNISGSGTLGGNLSVSGALNGNASGLTNLNATNITSGTLDNARLGVIPVSKGGTGLSTAGAAGNLLRSDGSAWTSSPLQATDVPGGSSNYVHNASSQQAGANFNIGGNGTAGGTLSASLVNVTTQYDIAGSRVLSVAGANNLFAGADAGSANTGGGRNSFVGAGAGQANTTGVSNSFFGSAGAANVSGGQNAFFGTFAGLANTASDNSFFGSSAGSSNAGGTRNSSFGRAAGSSNTNGNDNSFFGYQAGNANITGLNNSFFGASAGEANTGGNNSFFGASAGSSNTTGVGNTFVGKATGSSNTTENNNTFIGFQANGAAGITNATAIGAGAMVNASNTLVLGTSAVTVKVPGSLSITDDVSANQANLNALLVNGQTIIGGEATFAGPAFLESLGAAGSTSLCRNASNQIATCSSSLRYKTHVRPFLSGLAIINRLRPIAFTWKTDGSRDLGLGAEEVAAVEPLLIIRNSGGEVEGVKYDRLNVVLINAVKQQHQQIEQQQDRVNQQQSQIEGLKKLVCLDHPNAEVCK